MIRMDESDTCRPGCPRLDSARVRSNLRNAATSRSRLFVESRFPVSALQTTWIASAIIARMQVLGEFNVDLQLTEDARRFISVMLEQTDIHDPILGIGWGRWNHEKEEHWLLGLYSRPKCSGWLCKANGLEFVIVNPSLVERLHGRTLDIVKNQPRIQ